MMAANEIAAAEQMYASVEAAYAGRPLAEQATLRLAELQLAREEGADAMTLLQGLMADTNLLAETRAQVYQVVARALATETNLAAALDAIDKGIELAADPARQLENQVIKAQLLLQAGRLEEGSAAFRRAVAQIPEESLAARLQLNLADWLAHAGEREKAAEEYQAWLEAFEGEEGTADALAGYAWTLWEAGRYAEAAPMFARAALVESNESRQVNLLAKQADAEFAARQYSQAEKNYTRVLPLAGKDRQMQERIQLQLAETELALGKTQAGEVRLLDLSRTRGKSPFAQTATMRLGVLYEERGALESAVEQYSRLLAGEADAELKAEALLARGLIRYRMGSFQAALDDFTRIREEFSLTAPAAQAMFMRGWCLYLLGKDEEALEVCKRFLVEYPNSIFAPDVHFWLGEYAFNHGEYEEAENRFADVAREYPASPHAADALYWAGRAATARRAYLAANEHYNELMARYPDTLRLPETLLAQGDMLSELGQFALAIVAYDEVIGKAPQSVEAMIAWGRKGDSQYTLGQQESGRYEEALLSYRTLAESTSAALDLRLQAGYKTGRCLEKMGRETAALDRYMEVVYAYLQEARPTAETTVWFTRAAFRAATVQEKAGNWKQAVGIYRRVADAGVPSSTEARERISRIQREHWTQF
jgi:TolA-binding protein